MNKIMLDLETFATDSNARIVQIGSCWFDETGEIGTKFLFNIEESKKLDNLFTIDTKTIKWWLEQSDGARKSLKEPEPRDLEKVLLLFNDFAKGVSWIFSHSNFDFVILMNAYKKMGIEPSFSYKTSFDLRTLDKISKMCGYQQKQFERDGIHHNALSDCEFQVKYTCDMLQYLKNLRG